MALKILIVEDDPGLCLVTADRIRSRGFEVITASDGKEALNKARSDKPDLILLDIRLPKMDGFTVSRLLKFDDDFRKIPIIMTTAKSGEQDVKTGKETGADAYLLKPLDYDLMFTTIDEMLIKYGKTRGV